MSPEGHVDGGEGEGEDAFGAGGTGGLEELGGDGFDLEGVFADGEFAEVVDGGAEGGGEGAAEEGDADAVESFVGVEFEGDELAGAGLGDAGDEGVVGGGLEDSGGPVVDFHGWGGSF